MRESTIDINTVIARDEKERKKNYRRFIRIIGTEKRTRVFVWCLLLFVLLVFIFVLFFISFDLLPAVFEGVNLAAVSGAFIATYVLIWQVFKATKKKRIVATLGLIANVTKNNVVVTASIKNDGEKPLYPQMTNLYVMEGVKKNLYQHLYSEDIHRDQKLKHRLRREIDALKEAPHTIVFPTFNYSEGRPEIRRNRCLDCAFKRQCDWERDHLSTESERVSFPERKGSVEFHGTTQFAYNISGLSHHSIGFIMPKEKFTEEVIISLARPGIYKLFMVYTDKELAEYCICKSVTVQVTENSLPPTAFE